jgi:hypothetical protein
MGNHFFDPIVRLLQTKHSVRHIDVVGPCREEFASAFPDHEEYLPRTVRYFSEERDTYGKPLYQDTGHLPKWRP